MSRRSRTVLCCVVLLFGAATSAFLITRASPEPTRLPQSTTPQTRAAKKGLRNVSLQPDAAAVAHQLGQRFSAASRSTSVITGTVTISGNEQPLTLTRKQTETGEEVSVAVGNRSLTWSDQEGTRAGAGVLSVAERALVERLTLDSPDQFVLAQLRGASYFTVARNVRPADAADGYTGPLWNLVRVDEPEENDDVRPLSTWRIYYINVQTGLPDHVEYQVNGQTITVDFLEWTNQGEEKSPARVRWASNGQTLMELHVTSFSIS